MSDQPTGFTSATEAMSYAAPEDLVAVRDFVRSRALALGLPAGRAELLTLVVNELATNTVEHTSGTGRLRVWAENGQVVCDVTDSGASRPFGQDMPPANSVRGRGLAIVTRMSDEVSTFTDATGTVVRVRFNL